MTGDMGVAFTLWREGLVPSEALVEAATQALVDGLDSPSLRELAGVLKSEAPYLAPGLCERSLEELGLLPVDEDAARVALVRDHARRILSGDLREFEGARAVWWTFSASGDYPELTSEMLSLEDEWEGGWGRTEGEIREAIRRHAARILDVWGDPLSPIHRLHSAARRWLIAEHETWVEAYAGLIDRGEDRVGEPDGGWRYSEAAKALFPRYVVAEYLLCEVERSVPSEFADTVELRGELTAAAARAFERSHVRDEASANEEVEAFLAWVEQSPEDDGPLMPYRKTLGPEEEAHWAREFERRWGVTEGQWHPLLATQTPEDVVVLDSALWEHDQAIEAVRQTLHAQGVSVVVCINELQPSAEVAVSLFDPSYGSQGEVLATSTFPWWLLYTSHEGTTALTAGPLTDALGQRIADWDRWLIS